MTAVLAAALGAVVYRARGFGLWPGRPWWQIVFALAYAAVTFDVAWWAALIVLCITTGALLTGHASYMDLGAVPPGSPSAPKDGQTDEWYGAWIPGSGYWHDFVGLAVSGVLVSASAGIALMLGAHVLQGAAVVLSGALKAPAYALAWWLYRRYGREPIAIGEALTGALLWGSLALIINE